MSAARLNPLLLSAVAFELSIARCTHIFAASVPLLCPFVPPRCIRVSVLPGALKTAALDLILHALAHERPQRP